MKAIRFHEYGDADVLRYEEVELPVPGTGQVRIRVAATTFNSVDGTIRAGNMQGPMPLTLPHIPGLDVAGTVDALGEGAGGLQVGDRVIGFLPFDGDGAAADYVLAPAEILAPAPTSIPLADAAALPVVGLTAWQALVEHARLRSGQRILVNGASGAVGGYAVQLAKAAGAHVIATGRASSREHLLALGADEVIDHTTTEVGSALTEPVDVLLNLAPVTPEQLAALAARVGDGGVVVNTTVWMPAPSDEARGVRGIDLYVRSDAQQLSELVARVDRGELVVDVAERVALPDLVSVHARAAAGTLTGKVVVVPASEQ
jgi:NADPH:quinone reductase-like Zn-dependent oxidoreductase